MLGTRVTSRGLRQQARTDASDAVRIQRDASGPGTIRTLPPSVDEVLRSPGQALGAGQQRALHARMGFDFSGIRIHDDARAAASARELSAHAYTMGEHVVFGAGRYAPGSASGERLLRHELAHVVQQRQGRVPGRGVVTDAGLEGEADRVADGAPLVAGMGEGRGEAPAQALQRRKASTEKNDGFYDDASPLAEPAPAGAETTHEVKVRAVRVGALPEARIDKDFNAANEIYNPYGLSVLKAGPSVFEAPPTEQGKSLPLDIASGKDDPNLRKILNTYASQTDLTGLWIDNAEPVDSRGRAFKEDGVCAVNAFSAYRDTFAHELGHLIVREGHIRVSKKLSALAQAPGGMRNVSKDPQDPTDPRSQLNLMGAGAIRLEDAKNGGQLTSDQVERMRKNRYIRKRPQP